MIADEIDMMRVDESRPPSSRSEAVRVIKAFVKGDHSGKHDQFSASAALSMVKRDLTKQGAAIIKVAISDAARGEIDDITVRDVNKVLKTLAK